MAGGHYSVEVREATRGGDDYTEEHSDFDTIEETQKFINNTHRDEHIHSVLYYADGQTSNPRDVTHKFRKTHK